MNTNNPTMQAGFRNSQQQHREPPPARPIEFAPGCATCGQGQQFVSSFQCPGCGHNVNAR